MLAGVSTTGIDDPEYDEEELLDRALANLEKMVYIGLTERYQDSMLMLKRTFSDYLHRFEE